MRSLLTLILGIILVLPINRTRAQCSVTINTFPYQESFELGTAGWVSGGINNDWAWGMPNKPVITSAGAGNNCWIVGGLTGSFYAYGEKSWVESVCFDFTNIDRPYVSFLVFWETERNYDGGGLQYTDDGGITWRSVGSVNDPNACNTQNWFNITNIVNLVGLGNNTQGWSGTIQPGGGGCNGGGGSNGWKLATHCIPALANKPLVKFRFTFGAGTTCNDYDGFAFDDFYVGEAPGASNDFTYRCIGNNQVQFADVATECFNQWQWDFGDTASANNQSTTQGPVHMYSSGGDFVVTLTTSGSCQPDTVITHTIKLPVASIQTTDVTCQDRSDGTATVTLSNAGPVVDYAWSHDATLNSPVATGLDAGLYSVTLDDPTTCQLDFDFEISYGPDADPTVYLGEDSSICPGSVITLRPGSFSSYRWQDNSTTPQFRVTREGIYTVRVENAAGCSASDTIEFTFDCLRDILLPNAFSPNGDGMNDLLYAIGSETFTFKIMIFDRWGEMIFSTESRDEGWDGTYKGTIVQEGFYNYLVNYSIGREELTKKGSVFLFR